MLGQTRLAWQKDSLPQQIIISIVCARVSTHTHTHTLTYTYVHTHNYTHIHICAHLHIQTHIQTQTHWHTYTHMHTNIHVCTRIHTHLLLHESMHKHLCRDTHAHAHTHTHVHTHPRTHTHTHTQVYRDAIASPLCTAIHLTLVEMDVQCDTTFPEIDSARFRLWSSSEPQGKEGSRCVCCVLCVCVCVCVCVCSHTCAPAPPLVKDRACARFQLSFTDSSLDAASFSAAHPCLQCQVRNTIPKVYKGFKKGDQPPCMVCAGFFLLGFLSGYTAPGSSRLLAPAFGSYLEASLCASALGLT